MPTRDELIEAIVDIIEESAENPYEQMVGLNHEGKLVWGPVVTYKRQSVVTIAACLNPDDWIHGWTPELTREEMRQHVSDVLYSVWNPDWPAHPKRYGGQEIVNILDQIVTQE